MAGRHRKPSTLHRAHHRGKHRKPPSRPQAVVPAVIAVGVLAVGGVAFGHALANGQPPRAAGDLPGVHPTTPLIVSPPIATSSPTTAASPAPSMARTSQATRTPSHRQAPAAFVLTDRVGACYIEVKSAAGHLLVRRILRHGQRVTLREHHLRVTVGNAGAAWVSLNGDRPQRAGRVGKVVQFRTR